MQSSKLMRITAMSAFTLVSPSVRLIAEEQQPVSASESNLAAQHDENTIRVPDGTAVRFLVTDSIRGRTAKTGDPVQLRVIDDVKVGNLVVIANKTTAVAHIAELQHARRHLRAGSMSIKLDSVALVTGETQNLRGVSATKGTAYGEDMRNAIDPVNVYLLIVALPFLPLAHGEEAFLRKGTVLTAAFDGEALLDGASVKAHQPAAPAAKEGPASITVYWLFAQQSRVDHVFCGTVKLGELSLGRNFTRHLPAGSYWLRMRDKKRAIPFAAAPGEEYFVRVSPFGGNHLELVEHDVGEAEAADTRPLGSAKTLDVRSIGADR